MALKPSMCAPLAPNADGTGDGKLDADDYEFKLAEDSSLFGETI